MTLESYAVIEKYAEAVIDLVLNIRGRFDTNLWVNDAEWSNTRIAKQLQNRRKKFN